MGADGRGGGFELWPGIAGQIHSRRPGHGPPRAMPAGAGAVRTAMKPPRASPSSPALTLERIAWLVAALLVIILPHALRQPPWVITVFLALAGWRILGFTGRLPLPDAQHPPLALLKQALGLLIFVVVYLGNDRTLGRCRRLAAHHAAGIEGAGDAAGAGILPGGDAGVLPGHHAFFLFANAAARVLPAGRGNAAHRQPDRFSGCPPGAAGPRAAVARKPAHGPRPAADGADVLSVSARGGTVVEPAQGRPCGPVGIERGDVPGTHIAARTERQSGLSRRVQGAGAGAKRAVLARSGAGAQQRADLEPRCHRRPRAAAHPGARRPLRIHHHAGAAQSTLAVRAGAALGAARGQPADARSARARPESGGATAALHGAILPAQRRDRLQPPGDRRGAGTAAWFPPTRHRTGKAVARTVAGPHRRRAARA